MLCFYKVTYFFALETYSRIILICIFEEIILKKSVLNYFSKANKSGFSTEKDNFYKEDEKSIF
ncbi:hypothetical protein DZ858_12455 [Marixanthomonas ophiurae]|uniref:Uncharacterized protein n=1 Tax=Marixanthomonas ophiurae TaxID=387659 RepID=A0A3E1Q7D9_9FLAO|nr:hypothetical protein DZ858_12455 [Marixanthomonas ophiurae]